MAYFATSDFPAIGPLGEPTPTVRRPPRLAARCHELRLVVPPTFEALEQVVERWIASCVQSRTMVGGRPARRERGLVRGNPTLRRVWEQIRDAAGQTLTIRAEYIWGPERVESIRFTAPLSVYSFPPDVITARPPDTIERIVRRAIELLPHSARHGVRLTRHQQNRIGCMLRQLLQPGTDDRFLTGQSILDYKNLRSQSQPSYSQVTQWLLPEYNIRARRVIPDAEILRMLVRIDELVLQGRHRINYEFAAHGAAVDVRTQELRRWMEGRERDPRSIYHCYYLDSRGP